MTDHTPGPWAVCEKAPNDHWLAGCTVYSVPLGKRVCDASILNAEYTANAHVMAAAPEMLDALESAIDALSSLDARLTAAGEEITALDAYDSFYRDNTLEALAQARAAITKAMPGK